MANAISCAIQASVLALLFLVLSGCGSNKGDSDKTEVQWPFANLENLVMESKSVTSYSNPEAALETNTRFWLDNTTSFMRFEQNESRMGGLTMMCNEIANDTTLTTLSGSVFDTTCVYSEINSAKHSASASSSFSSLFLWSPTSLPSHMGVEACPDDEESRSCDRWNVVGSLAHQNQTVNKTYWIQANSTKLLRAETKVRGLGSYRVNWFFSKWEVNGSLARELFAVPESWSPCQSSAAALAGATLAVEHVLV